MSDEQVTVTSPHTSHDAAATVDQLRHELTQRRRFAGQYANTLAKCEHIYKRERAKAYLQIDAPNAEQREAMAYEWDLPGDVRVEASAVAEAMGLSGYTPTTVGELRWMRDRAKSLAETWRDRAFDAREDVKAYVMVAAMAKQEAQLGMVPEDRVPA